MYHRRQIDDDSGDGRHPGNQIDGRSDRDGKVCAGLLGGREETVDGRVAEALASCNQWAISKETLLRISRKILSAIQQKNDEGSPPFP